MSKIKKKLLHPTVSVAIFHFNGLADTKQCLKALLKTKYSNFTIQVIDDGSTNDDVSILQKTFRDPRIKYFKDGKNKGFAVRANEALRNTSAKYVMLLNNDTEVMPDWLSPLVKVAEADKNVAICQSKLRWLTYPEFFEYSGAGGGYLDRIGHSYAKGRMLFSLEKDTKQYEDESEIFWSSGAAMFIRRSIVSKIGWFDEDLHSYQEEVDYCWRAKKLGLSIKIVPKSVVYHKGSSSWGKQLTKKIYLVHRNSLVLLIKHLSILELVWILPLRLILDYAILLFYVWEGRLNYPFAVIKAHVAVMLFSPHWFSKRSSGTNPHRTPTSVIWEYFVNHKKTYGQLISSSYKPEPIVGYQKLFKKQQHAR